eukprot:307086-Hanusia_phi.AAC.1
MTQDYACQRRQVRSRRKHAAKAGLSSPKASALAARKRRLTSRKQRRFCISQRTASCQWDVDMGG